MAASRSLRLIAPLGRAVPLALGAETRGRSGSVWPGPSAIPSAFRCSWRRSWRRRRSTRPGESTGRRLELVVRDDYADPDSAVFVAGDLYDSDVSAVVGHLFSGTTLAAAPVYNGGDDARRGDLTFVVLARGVQRRRAHLPRVPQRPGPRRGARPLGPRTPGPRARRGALPERSVRPRHPPDLRGAVHPARRPAPVDRSLSRRQARRRPISRPPRARPSGSSSWWWPATGARPRK